MTKSEGDDALREIQDTITEDEADEIQALLERTLLKAASDGRMNDVIVTVNDDDTVTDASGNILPGLTALVKLVNGRERRREATARRLLEE